MLRAVAYKAGVVQDDTAYSALGYATDSDQIRWVRGRAQTLGGYTDGSPGFSYLGICRGMHPWVSNTGLPYMAIGTTNKLYVNQDGTSFDVTPLRASSYSADALPYPGTMSALTGPFTTNGTTTVTVASTGHGGINGSWVILFGGSTVGGQQIGGKSGSFAASPFTTSAGSPLVHGYLAAHGMKSGDRILITGGSAVGGITVANTIPYTVNVNDANTFTIQSATVATASTFGGGTPSYVVGTGYAITYVDANTYTVTIPNAASAASGGGTVNFEYEINPGIAQGSGPGGYGQGGYGLGQYGLNPDPAHIADFEPRTWSMDHFGQNLVVNPLGGGIYEWDLNLSQRAYRIPNSPAICDSIAVSNERVLLAFACTQITGGATGTYGTNPFAFTVGSPTVTVTQAAHGLGTYDTVGIVGSIIANTTISSGLTTIDGTYNVTVTGANTYTITLWGGVVGAAAVSDGGTVATWEYGIYEPLGIRWTDVQQQSVWVPNVVYNVAGDAVISGGSRLIAGKRVKNGIMAWTDNSVHLGTYVGSVDQVYAFNVIGNGCGLIGPNAAVERDGTAFWLTPGSGFYRYAGGVPEPLQNPNRQTVQKALAPNQGYKVYALMDVAFSGVSWLYPASPGTECNRYIRLDTMEQSDPNSGWSVGNTTMTAWVDRSALPNPYSFSSTGVLCVQDSGLNAAGAAIDRFVTWAPIDIAGDGYNGQHVANIRRVVFDAEIDNGGAVTVTLSLRRWPNGTIQTKGPYIVTQATDKLDVRGQGRQIGVTYESSGTQDHWRVGSIRYDISEGPLR
jgi:hypothetical protein